jgi:hypothetical protein
MRPRGRRMGCEKDLVLRRCRFVHRYMRTVVRESGRAVSHNRNDVLVVMTMMVVGTSTVHLGR